MSTQIELEDASGAPLAWGPFASANPQAEIDRLRQLKADLYALGVETKYTPTGNVISRSAPVKEAE